MIPPALTAKEWSEALAWRFGITDYLVRPAELLGGGQNSPSDLARVIALANAALPDDDPRKITWAMADDAREAYRSAVILATHAQNSGDETERQRYRALAIRYAVLADALASYLPPREAKP